MFRSSGLKAQPWTKPVTVNSPAATTPCCSMAATPMTAAPASAWRRPRRRRHRQRQALNWFDTNIHDAALRQLLRTDDSDGAISRNEEIGVFQKVEQDGIVNSNEFVDLKAVAQWLAVWLVQLSWPIWLA